MKDTIFGRRKLIFACLSNGSDFNVNIVHKPMHQLTVGGLTVEVIRKEIKNLHLLVHPPEGRVRIASPVSITDESVRLYVVSRLSWIRKQQARFQGQKRQSQRNCQTRESHYFRGMRYLLFTVEQTGVSGVCLRQKNRMYLYAGKNATPQRRRQILAAWYRTQLRERAAPLMEKWQAILGVQASSWRIRQMKTRWGTCNPGTGRILLNLELIKKPEPCLEYIVVHELLHLIEHRHNDAFKALLDTHLPNWRLYRDQLNGFIL